MKYLIKFLDGLFKGVDKPITPSIPKSRLRMLADLRAERLRKDVDIKGKK